MKHDEFETPFEAAMYIWDHFISEVPRPRDERTWKAIERATHRLLEPVQRIEPSFPPDVRLANARLVRKNVRRAVMQIAKLSVKVEPWVLKELDAIDGFAEYLLDVLQMPEHEVIVH